MDEQALLLWYVKIPAAFGLNYFKIVFLCSIFLQCPLGELHEHKSNNLVPYDSEEQKEKKE